MIGVLDASAAIELILKRSASTELESAIADADYIAVPDLYVAEVSNALWKIASVAPNEFPADSLLVDAMALPDEFVTSQELFREAFAFARGTNHLVYDCLHTILARRNNAQLLTMDRRLRTLASEEGILVLPVAK